MDCSLSEFMQYINEEDIKFIRLAFCDVYGKQKNISIMSDQLEKAFKNGVSFEPDKRHNERCIDITYDPPPHVSK